MNKCLIVDIFLEFQLRICNFDSGNISIIKHLFIILYSQVLPRMVDYFHLTNNHYFLSQKQEAESKFRIDILVQKKNL